MNMHGAAMLPEEDEIRADLEWMTSRWPNYGTFPFLFEVRAIKDGGPINRRFNVEEIEDAVAWVAEMNEGGRNLYVTRNPLKHDTPPISDEQKGARDENVAGAFFLWADCDDERSVANARAMASPKCTAHMVTGSEPFTRVHLYWALEDFCGDMDRHRTAQRAIADRLQSDTTVTNPSRIMRIGGTVTHPNASKIGRGYVKEKTRLVLPKPHDAPRFVTVDQIIRAFAPTTSQDFPRTSQNSGLSVDTGTYGPQLDRQDAYGQAASGINWHHNVVKLTASYVARGMQDHEIHAITDNLTLTGYTVEDTRREVQQCINDARKKGFTPKTAPGAMDFDAVPGQQTEQTGQIILPKLVIQSSQEFAGNPAPPVYLIDGVLQQGFTHALTGYTGHGKTTLALHLVLAVATGGRFGEVECEQGSVLFLAGENPDNVRFQYAAAVAALGVPMEDLPVQFLPGHFQLSVFGEALRQEMDKVENLKLVVVDSLQAFFEGEDDNSNMSMVDMAQRFRAMAETENAPSVVVLTHPSGKKPDKDNLIPRGGSAFMNEIDGNFTVWAEPDGSQEFAWAGKHRGAHFEPMPFVLEDKEFDHLVDHKGRNLRLKVARRQMIAEQLTAAERVEQREKQMLQLYHDQPQTSTRAMASALGTSRSTVQRSIEVLTAEKLITRHAKAWKVTAGGKEYAGISDE